MQKIKLLILVALVATFFMPLSLFADEGSTEATTSETTAAETTTTETAAEEKPFIYQIEVFDLSTGEIINKLSLGYELKSILGLEKLLEVHVKKVVEPAGYVVAKTVLGKAWIELERTKATIYAHPAKKAVQVIHRLYRCDGTVKHDLLEVIEVPYLTELSKDTAKDMLKSKIEKVSGRGYVVKAIKVEPYEPIPYRVYDMDGHEVTPEASRDTIYIYYLDEACAEETIAQEGKIEPKGDTEEEQKTEGELHSLPSTLPATGDNSLMAVLIASALMSLGIFLLKR